MKNKKWPKAMWIATVLYFTLSFFNILFAWLGLICFIAPLAIAFIKGNKAYCNQYCGRSRLFVVFGKKMKLSRNKNTPKMLYSNWFRYVFLAFFMLMFFIMILNTYFVFTGAELKPSITLLWTFKLPWSWVDVSIAAPWMAQFAFGFFSVMLTSTILGFALMFLYKPRTWCVACPMGTMTQGICKIKHKKKDEKNGRKSEGSCEAA